MARSIFPHSSPNAAIQLAIVALPLAAVYLLLRNEALRHVPRKGSGVDRPHRGGAGSLRSVAHIADDGQTDAMAVIGALEAVSEHLQRLGATAGMIAIDLRRMSLPRLPRVSPDELQIAL